MRLGDGRTWSIAYLALGAASIVILLLRTWVSIRSGEYGVMFARTAPIWEQVPVRLFLLMNLCGLFHFVGRPTCSRLTAAYRRRAALDFVSSVLALSFVLVGALCWLYFALGMQIP